MVAPKNTQTVGIALILVGALLFGLMPAAAKFAYQEGANALMVMLGRSVGGLAILLLFIHATGRSPNVTLGNLRRATLAGVSHTFATVGILASIVYIDISLASIILFLYPFPIAIIAHFRGETPLSAPIILLMLLATAGLALVLGVDFASLDVRGVAFAVMGMLGFTVMILAMAELTKTVGAPNSNLFMTIWAAAIFVVIAALGPATGLVGALEFPATFTGWLFVAVIALTFSVGYLCFFVSANMIGAARASLLSTSEPAMMILFAVLLVGETLGAAQWLGVVIVIPSLSLSEFFRR